MTSAAPSRTKTLAKASQTLRKRERRHGCQRLGRVVRRGKTKPTLSEIRVNPDEEDRVRTSTRRSGSGVVKRPLPRSCSEEARLFGAPLTRKRQERAGNTRGTGTREVVRVARIDRTHRASSPPGGRKTSWWSKRALAGKGARKHRLTRGTGQGDGETVREGTSSNSGTTWLRPAGFRLAGSWIRGEALSESSATGLHGHGVASSSAGRSTSWR